MARALSNFGNFIAGLSSLYEWQSFLQLFVDHSRPRLQVNFHVEGWHEAGNSRAMMLVLKPKVARPAAAARLDQAARCPAFTTLLAAPTAAACDTSV